MKFKCEECGEIIEKGKCGEHREQSGHKEFDILGGNPSERKIKTNKKPKARMKGRVIFELGQKDPGRFNSQEIFGGLKNV